MIRSASLAPMLALVALLEAPEASASWSSNGDPVCSAPRVQTSLIAIPAPGCIADPCPNPSFSVWIDSRDSAKVGNDLYYSIVEPPGVSDPPPGGTPLCTAPGYRSDPVALALEPRGGALPWAGVLVAWSDSRNGNSDIYAIKPFGGVAPPWTANGIPVCTASGSQSGVSATTSGWGGSILAWLDQRLGTYAIYAQRLDDAGGALWAMDGIPLLDDSNVRFTPRVASDGAEGAYVAWTQYGPTLREVRVLRITSSGALSPGWPANGRLVTTGNSDETLADVLADGSGGLILLWHSGTSDPTRQLHALKLAADGSAAAGWPAAGRTIATGGLSTLFMDALVVDGGVVAGWREDSDWSDVFPMPPIDTDLHLQKIASNGLVASGWPDTGVVLCSASGGRSWMRLERSGSGFIAAWQDSRAGEGQEDIYATRIEPSGALDPEWPANGVAICSAGARQTQPVACSAGEGGGVIVFWLDERNVHSDIYARLVGPAGTTGVEPRPDVTSFRLGLPSPNPFSQLVRLPLELASDALVQADVVDPAGRRVARIARENFTAGRHELRWSGNSDQGVRARPGVYFIRVRVAGEVSSRLLVRLE
jgi:hypothetical protein